MSGGQASPASRATIPALLVRLGPLCATIALGFLSVSVPLAVLALYVHEALGFSASVAGLTVGLQSFATIGTRAYAGRLVDRIGSKPTLTRGLGVAAASGAVALGSTLAAASPSTSLVILLASRLMLGIGESLLITGVLSWAIARAGEGRGGLAIGWNGMAVYGALAAGAPIGFALFRAFGFPGVAAAATVLPLVAIIMVAPLSSPEPSGGERLALSTVIVRIAAPGLALCLAGVGFAAITTFAALDFYVHAWAGAERALLLFGLCFVVVRIFASGLPDRHGGRRVAAVSIAVAGLGQLLLWVAPDAGTALAGAGLTGAGCSLVFPSLGLIAVRRVPAEARGIAVGAFAAFQDLAIGLTGPLLGALAMLASYPAVFLVGALAAAVGAAISLTLRDPPPP